MNCLPRFLLLVVSGAALAHGSWCLAEPTAEQLDFFEKKVRPILVERCQKCHGAEKQESGLRLDRREMAFKGSDSGQAIVPGDPDKSLLIEAVRYQGDIQMPPAGKLPDEEIALLVAWIKSGAPWPGSLPADGPPGPGNPPSAQDAQTTHWAYRPVVRPAVPAVKAAEWCQNSLDRFILHELEGRGLSPSPPVDRRTLLRRASYDLIGLPPTAAEVEAFEHDSSPAAWPRVVDRLLASPQYGERWARHWLDVARYADTKGYVFNQEMRYPFSYTYRDYVIRAMNADLPYDRFIVEQIAADQLALGDDNRPLAALGFLTLGRRFMNNTHDIIDDRIDVVSRGLMGLTVTCARCHDHKFDPIPTADYYSLYGVFASSQEPAEEPLVGVPEETTAYAQFKQELAARHKAVDDYQLEQQAVLAGQLRSRTGDYLAYLTHERPGAPPSEEPMLSLSSDDLRRPVIDRWRQYLKQTVANGHQVFMAWHALAAIPSAEFAQQAPAAYDRWSSAEQAGQPMNAIIKQTLVERRPATMMDVARLYGEVLAGIEKEWSEARKAAPPPERLADAAKEELRQVLYGADAPVTLPPELARKLFNREVRDHLTGLQRRVEEWIATSPASPPRAMALVDAPAPFESYIFVRGNPARHGERVPRRFLQVLSHGQREPFKHGSGRLDLAQAIASRDNPLTARVLVNRVWLHHFSSALVNTPSDFGVRTDRPTHPELLDWLASAFMDEGWSLKRLHRLILLSGTYQQAGIERPDCVGVDPENRLLWRMNRRRLDLESMHDSYLAVAGRLDRTFAGRPVDIWAAPFSARRGIYAYIDRQDLPGVFRVFDFASPDSSNESRPRTTVPQQALFAMNSPFVIEQVRRVNARPEVANEANGARRVQALYRILFERQPREDELELARRFLAAAPSFDEISKLSPWELYVQVLLSANEFMFVD